MSQDDDAESSTTSHPQNGKTQRSEKDHERDVDPLRRHIVDRPRRQTMDRHDEENEPDDDDEESDEQLPDESGEADDDETHSSKSKNKDGKESDPDDSSEKDDPKKKGNPRGKLILAIVGGALIILLLVVALPWYLHARHFESTDDAFVDAHWEKISPRVAGRVLHVNFDDNEYVKAGDILLKIDPADFDVMGQQQEAAVAEAQGRLAQQIAQQTVAVAGVGQAQAEVDRMAVTRDNDQLQLNRYEGLSAEAVSRQQLDDLRAALRSADAQLASSMKGLDSAKAQVTLAQSQIEAAKAQVASSQAQLANARLQLSYTDVKAITNGRVTQRGVQDGDYVTPGQQLLVLVPDLVWVTANYKETQLTDMRKGQDVDLTVDAFPDQTLHGRIDSIQAGSGQWFSLLPPENATGNYVKVVQRVPVKILFDDTGSETYKKLGPGMSVVPKVKVR